MQLTVVSYQPSARAIVLRADSWQLKAMSVSFEFLLWSSY
jgi:hypothetical protein